MSSRVDRLYLDRQTSGADFVFDEGVAGVFDNMIERSVPLYQEVQRVTARLAAQFARPNCSIVDIGCSTGTTLIGIAGELSRGEFSSPAAEMIGIDNSQSMLDRCSEKLVRAGIDGDVRLILADAASGLPPVEPAPAVAILNYTLQFIQPEHRTELLTAICDMLLPGGCLIVSEKVRSADPQLEQLITGLHHQFKRENGYSELEISRKRDALEQVLIPWSIEQNSQALLGSGFSRVEVILKWYQFTTLIAVK